MKIAIIGTGIAGLGAARLLAARHDVRIFEAGPRPGGHANTVDVTVEGRTVPVDTGFIVYNEANYPNFTRLLSLIGAETSASDMSFGVSVGEGRFEYAGSVPGLLAQPSNLLRPAYWAMLRDVTRFFRDASALLDAPVEDDPSLGEWLSRSGYCEPFVHDHLMPMAAAIWSCPVGTMFAFPARSFIRFFANHGLLSYGNRPAWRTVSGGSRAYVERLVAPFRDRLHCGRAVTSVARVPGGVRVRDRTGMEGVFDQVVMATHADRSLTLRAHDASPAERRILGAFRYEANHAVLHRDTRLMPRRRAVWSSWNYLADSGRAVDRKVSLTYWMNRLQPLPVATPLLVTLNPIRPPDPILVDGVFDYEHPVFDAAAVAAQRDLGTIQGAGGIWYCGSYCGYGFHEDALKSGIAVAAALGARLPWDTDVVPAGPMPLVEAA